MKSPFNRVNFQENQFLHAAFYEILIESATDDT